MRQLLLLGVVAATLTAIGPRGRRIETPHKGTNVVFVHYHWGYEGQTRAARLLTEPGACPTSVEEDGVRVELSPTAVGCANIRFWTERPDETENPSPVLDALGVPTGTYVNTGSDWRCCVEHDPSGKVPRSWHVYGEAAGEE